MRPDTAPANDNGGLRFLSVCSGIEAASVAWPDWTPVAFSEIEKFPSAVLAHHYPDVPNLGDFTKIDTTTLGRVDILCGGTPCQAFSVAGLRKGLDDERGNLTLKFVELAHELAGLGKTDGNGLRNVVWENVVGILSDKSGAFGCFLAGLVGADAPIVPPGRWTNAGMVSGPRGRAAWRVLDAQYFGVAQRRRRVIVVADFGNGADPAAVLLIEQGLPRNPPARGEAGKDVAADVAQRAGSRSHWDGDFPHPTLNQSAKGSGGIAASNQEIFSQRGAGLVQHAADVAPCLRAGGNSTGGDRPPGTDVDTADSLIAYAPEIARCVATREGSSQDYETTTMVAVGVTGEISHTLKAEGADASEDGTGRGTPIVAQTVAIRGRDGGATAELGGEVATALRASQGGGDKPHVLYAPDVYSTLSASEGGTMTQILPIVTSAVRRLTPRECERLQGFQWLCSPDYPGAWQDEAGRWWSPDYTAIPWRGKPNSPDGPRYKSLGNSWAVPKFVWLGKRIAKFMPPVTTPVTTAAANDNTATRNAA